MKYTVLFSDDAEDDVTELLAYIVEQGGELVARRYVDRLIDYCYSFEDFPERGIRSDVDPRICLVGYRRRATIVFRVDDETVVLLRVYHRGRDIDPDDYASGSEP